MINPITDKVRHSKNYIGAYAPRHSLPSREETVEYFATQNIPNLHCDALPADAPCKQNTFPRWAHYIRTSWDHKFIISPEGNGIDCHRHYEALYLKSIPIIPNHPLMRLKFKNLPVVWTEDYRVDINGKEITLDYLRRQYNRWLDKQFDFKFILLSSYPPPLRAILNRRALYRTDREKWKEKYQRYVTGRK